MIHADHKVDLTVRVEGVGSLDIVSVKKKVEGCHVWWPTLDLRWTGEIGSSYLCCMEVGTKVGEGKISNI
jgi:hypothetical protein